MLICDALSGSAADLLPMNFPAGVDPSTYALPVFLIEPTAAFAAKGRPAVLKCRAAHAIAVRFVCNDEAMDTASEAEGAVSAGGEDGLKFLEATLEIKRGQVFDVLGHFSCKCVAQSERGAVETEEVLVQTACKSLAPPLVAFAHRDDRDPLADLRREFETPPYDQLIEVGGQGELRCHPPRGQPEAVVTHWLKDGAPIAHGDSNFIQSAAGHLLILQARMEDSANYTCVASNSALQRLSPAAEVTVFGKRSTFI